MLTVLLAAAVASSVFWPDPLQDTIAQWQQFLASPAANAAPFSDIKTPASERIAHADDALKHDRRLLALYELTGALPLLKAAEFAAAHRKDDLQQAWNRAQIAKANVPAFASIEPALARAIAEANATQAREYYDASLAYGNNTAPEAGIYYIGAANGCAFVADYVRHVALGREGSAPHLRSLAPDLDALEGEILAAYKPPASIDQHAKFIGASALLKEARELDAAGMRDAALLRYLESWLRIAPVIAPAIARADIERTLAREKARVEAAGGDESIAALFLESAAADLERSAEAPIASAIVTRVLPRYFAALAPALPQAKAVTPSATVTLVRWPYT